MKREYVIFGAILVVVSSIAFASGMQFQKSLKPVSATSTIGPGNSANGFGFGGGRGRFRGARPTLGTVATISGTTMTMTTRANTTVTVSLASSPTIINNGSSASLSDIQVGADVAVIGSTGSDGTITATRVLLNPSFGGAPAGAGPAMGI